MIVAVAPYCETIARPRREWLHNNGLIAPQNAIKRNAKVAPGGGSAVSVQGRRSALGRWLTFIVKTFHDQSRAKFSQ